MALTCASLASRCSPAASDSIRIQTRVHFDRKERRWLWRQQVSVRVRRETLVAYLLCAGAVRRSFPPNIPMLAWSSPRRISCCSFVNTDQPRAHWHGRPTVVGALLPVGHFLNKTINCHVSPIRLLFEVDFCKCLDYLVDFSGTYNGQRDMILINKINKVFYFGRTFNFWHQRTWYYWCTCGVVGKSCISIRQNIYYLSINTVFGSWAQLLFSKYPNKTVFKVEIKKGWYYNLLY